MIEILFSVLLFLIIIFIFTLRKIKIKNFLTLFICGTISIILSFIINKTISLIVPITIIKKAYPLLYYIMIVGFSEEISKYISLKLSKPKTSSEYYLNAIMISSIFILFENLEYSKIITNYLTLFERFALPMHILFQIIMVYFINLGNKNNNKKRYTLIALVLSILIHGLFDYIMTICSLVIIRIILSLICYFFLFYVLFKCIKKEDTLVNYKEKFKVLKFIIVFIITLFFVLILSNINKKISYGEYCKYQEGINIGIISSEIVEQTDYLSSEVGKYLRLEINLKNDTDDIYNNFSSYSFKLVNMYNGKEIDSELFTFLDALSTDALANTETSGYIYFKIGEEDINKYNLIYEDKYNYDSARCILKLK